jgi:inorganic triphosphatase YgiF
MTEPREIEAKFEADPDVLEQLLQLRSFAGFSVTFHPAQDQDDTYFDTEHDHLKHAGASLRIRRKGNQLQLTFKGDRIASADDPHIVSRLEDQVMLAGDVSRVDPESGPLRLDPEPAPLSRARSLAAGAELRPVARLLTSRTVLIARDNLDHEVELAVDRCQATRLTDDREVRFAEVEAELVRGDAGVLEAAITGLMSALPGLMPSARTKLERALD